jgi:hypothetical protein
MKPHSKQPMIRKPRTESVEYPQSTMVTALPKTRSNLRTRQVDGETVVLDREGGLVHQFNQTASYVWERLDGTTSITTIARQLVRAFEVDSKTAETDVARIVSELERLNLLEVAVPERVGA